MRNLIEAYLAYIVAWQEGVRSGGRTVARQLGRWCNQQAGCVARTGPARGGGGEGKDQACTCGRHSHVADQHAQVACVRRWQTGVGRWPTFAGGRDRWAASQPPGRQADRRAGVLTAVDRWVSAVMGGASSSGVVENDMGRHPSCIGRAADGAVGGPGLPQWMEWWEDRHSDSRMGIAMGRSCGTGRVVECVAVSDGRAQVVWWSCSNGGRSLQR